MLPTLSVVIPVKDDAPALERCLSLLDAQTVRAMEVVVVDNNSSDHSAAVAVAHGARVVVELAPGIPAAASAGYDAARGDVIVRCDADTRPPPDWLARIEQTFADDDGLQALTGSGDFYDVSRARAATLGRAYLASYYVSMHAAMAHPPLWGSNMALRAATWRAVAGVVHRTDPELHDDVDLAFALGPTVRLRYDPSLRVGVSGRSLVGGHLARRRMRRALRTLSVNWAVAPPWERWAVRLGRAHRAGPPSGPAQRREESQA